MLCRTVPDCSPQTVCRSSKLSPCGSVQSTGRRSKQARRRAVKMRTAYLGVDNDVDDVGGLMTETGGRTLPSPLDVTRPRPQRAHVDDDVDDDTEACQLYQWTQNLSVEDFA